MAKDILKNLDIAPVTLWSTEKKWNVLNHNQQIVEKREDSATQDAIFVSCRFILIICDSRIL